MTNNGTVVVGVIAVVSLAFGLFMYLDSNEENTSNEINTVDNVHTHSPDEIVGISQSIEGVTQKVNSFTEVVDRVESVEKKIDAIVEITDVDVELTPTEIFKSSEESVVQVNILRGETDGGVGSGFVYSEQGHIITNQHVVKKANKVTITFLDGESYIGEVIGRDADLDIAVVKVEPTNTYLQPIKIGDSSELKVGEKIAAIGNPFGLSGSMTSGIVSQMGRLLPQETGYSIPDVIQTDAAINPGNSGGPLLDLDGNVIGINTAIATRSGGYMGIGFAIPSNMAMHIVNQLINC